LNIEQMMGNPLLFIGQYFAGTNVHTSVHLKGISANNMGANTGACIMSLCQLNSSAAFSNTGGANEHRVSPQWQAVV
jgi:hypothetical protein